LVAYSDVWVLLSLSVLALGINGGYLSGEVPGPVRSQTDSIGAICFFIYWLFGNGIFNHGLFSVFILLLMRLSWYSQGCSVLRLVAPLPDIFSKLTAIPVC